MECWSFISKVGMLRLFRSLHTNHMWSFKHKQFEKMCWPIDPKQIEQEQAIQPSCLLKHSLRSNLPQVFLLQSLSKSWFPLLRKLLSISDFSVLGLSECSLLGCEISKSCKPLREDILPHLSLKYTTPNSETMLSDPWWETSSSIYLVQPSMNLKHFNNVSLLNLSLLWI